MMIGGCGHITVYKQCLMAFLVITQSLPGDISPPAANEHSQMHPGASSSGQQ